MVCRFPYSFAEYLLVEGLGVGGGAGDVGVTGSLVGASGELELVGGLVKHSSNSIKNQHCATSLPL